MDEKDDWEEWLQSWREMPDWQPPRPRKPTNEEVQAFRDEVERWQTAYRFDPDNFGGAPVLLWLAELLDFESLDATGNIGEPGLTLEKRIRRLMTWNGPKLAAWIPRRRLLSLLRQCGVNLESTAYEDNP